MFPFVSSPARSRDAAAGRGNPCSMSSSRLHSVCTGLPGTAAAMTAACAMKSTSRRRPKPPPISIGCTVTSCTDRLVPNAAASRAKLGTCVPVQTLTPDCCTCTVQFIGSMVAWARYGASYNASTTWGDPASAATAFPSERNANPPSVIAAFRNCSCICTDDSVAFGPGSHVTFSAPSACLACHHELATIATPAWSP